MRRNDDTIRFVLPNGTRWITKASSPLSGMLAEVVSNIMKQEDEARPGQRVESTRADHV